MSNPAEKRSEDRVDTKTTFYVEIYSDENSDNIDDTTTVIICNSLDISANGIQVQMDTEIPVGSILRICADLDNVDRELYLVGEARWVTREDDHYNIGFILYDAEDTDIIGWKNEIAQLLQHP